ncbi:MAG: outer membrane lipoprotein carrier protein LolA [Pseudomonadota bacterium]
MKQLINSIIFIFCCCLLFPVAPSLGNDISIEDALAALENKYDGKSFEAHFNQILTISAIDITETASGRVWFSHPGKMKWQYLQPEHYEFITNGKTLWLYQPEENQVIVSNADSFFQAGGGGTFLSDFSSVRKNYLATIAQETPDKIKIELIPKIPIQKVVSIEIWVKKQSYEISQVITHDELENTTQIYFKNLSFAQSHPAMFEFTPPDGTTILKED